jgi:hypothetical protein
MFHPAACELLQSAADDRGAFAIARYVDDKPIHDRLLLRLKTNGSFDAATPPLELQGWSAATALVAGGGQALAMLSEMVSQTPYINRAAWFAANWDGKKLNYEPLGSWDDINVASELRGAAFGRTILWAGGYRADPDQPLNACLLLAKGSWGRRPTRYPTNIPCAGTSHPISAGTQRYLLVSNGHRQLDLWTITDCQNPQWITTVAKASGTTQLIAPQLVQPDRKSPLLICFWCEHQPQIKQKRSRLWAREFATKSASLGEPVPVSDDEQVVGPTFQAHRTAATTLLTWESRSTKKSVIQCARLRDLKDITMAALPGRVFTPLFVVDVDGESLVGPLFRKETNGWRV